MKHQSSNFLAENYFTDVGILLYRHRDHATVTESTCEGKGKKELTFIPTTINTLYNNKLIIIYITWSTAHLQSKPCYFKLDNLYFAYQ